MKFGFATLAIIAAATVDAANHQVTLGLTGLVYSPNSVTAAVGDTIEFIVSGTHSIVEAAFNSPCSYMTGGAWSGLAPQPNFVITVTDTTPRFFYCSVATHCQSGMVFALNPSSSETESAFASAAGSVSNSVTPSGPPVGGTSGPVPSGASSTTTSPAASSSAAASSSEAASSSAAASSSSAGAATSMSASSAATARGTASGASAGSVSAATGTGAATGSAAGSGTAIVAFSEGGKIVVGRGWGGIVLGIVLAMIVARH